MSRRRRDLSIIALLLITALGAAVRLPGIFWGLDPHSDPSYIPYHPDEPYLAGLSNNLFADKEDKAISYPTGFPLQVALISLFSGHFKHIDIPGAILLGRTLSLLYGIMTILLIYLFTLELFGGKKAALAAALFLSLSGLHVTQSHYATADAAGVFWLYMTIFASLLFVRKKGDKYLLLAALSCGICLSLKLAAVSVIPVIYILSRDRGRRYRIPAVLIILAVFALATGGRFGPGGLALSVRRLFYDNVNVIKEHNTFLNPFVYLFGAVPAVGLPVFLLFLYGTGRLTRTKAVKGVIKKDVFFTVLLPAAVHIILISFLDVPFSRHILPAVPLLAVAAAYGFTALKKARLLRKKTAGLLWLALLISAYQLVYVASIERYFITDTRESAGMWIRENIPYGAEIAATPYAEIPALKAGYRTDLGFRSRYLILHESYYYRYIRSELNPLSGYPPWSRIYHGDPGHFIKIQAILKGESPYKLIKAFRVKSLTPEMLLYKKALGTYPLFIGDTLIYKR